MAKGIALRLSFKMLQHSAVKHLRESQMTVLIRSPSTTVLSMRKSTPIVAMVARVNVLPLKR